MKATITIQKEIEIKWITISIPVRYGEEDIPNDFPLRTGNRWEATVNIDTGQIEGWPQGKTGDMHMKVCDGGTFILLDGLGRTLASIREECVPNRVVPGEYGDYVNLKINEQGIITNWPKRPNVQQFFPEQTVD